MPRGIPNYPRSGESEPPPEADTPAPRAEQTRRERRVRDPGQLNRNFNLALAVPPEVQARWDREGKVGRWVRDNENRLDQMFRRDWDLTPGVKAVAASKDGADGKMVLVEKYADWYAEDQLVKAAELDRTDRSMERGRGTDMEVPKSEYVDSLMAGNRISRRRRG